MQFTRQTLITLALGFASVQLTSALPVASYNTGMEQGNHHDYDPSHHGMKYSGNGDEYYVGGSHPHFNDYDSMSPNYSGQHPNDHEDDCDEESSGEYDHHNGNGGDHYHSSSKPLYKRQLITKPSSASQPPTKLGTAFQDLDEPVVIKQAPSRLGAAFQDFDEQEPVRQSPNRLGAAFQDVADALSLKKRELQRGSYHNSSSHHHQEEDCDDAIYQGHSPSKHHASHHSTTYGSLPYYSQKNKMPPADDNSEDNGNNDNENDLAGNENPDTAPNNDTMAENGQMSENETITMKKREMGSEYGINNEEDCEQDIDNGEYPTDGVHYWPTQKDHTNKDQYWTQDPSLEDCEEDKPSMDGYPVSDKDYEAYHPSEMNDAHSPAIKYTVIKDDYATTSDPEASKDCDDISDDYPVKQEPAKHHWEYYQGDWDKEHHEDVVKDCEESEKWKKTTPAPHDSEWMQGWIKHGSRWEKIVKKVSKADSKAVYYKIIKMIVPWYPTNKTKPSHKEQANAYPVEWHEDDMKDGDMKDNQDHKKIEHPYGTVKKVYRKSHHVNENHYQREESTKGGYEQHQGHQDHSNEYSTDMNQEDECEETTPSSY